MNTYEFFQYIQKAYIELWNIGSEYYHQLISEGVEPEKAEKFVQAVINKVFRETFNF